MESLANATDETIDRSDGSISISRSTLLMIAAENGNPIGTAFESAAGYT